MSGHSRIATRARISASSARRHRGQQRAAAVKAADIMVLHVSTVGLGIGVKELADIILANRVSAVPVIGEHGELVGIVSESDLVRHFGIGIEHRLELLAGNQPLAAGYVRSHSHKVADVMTREVIAATLDTPVRDVAALLEKNDIEQVPIVSAGKLV